MKISLSFGATVLSLLILILTPDHYASTTAANPNNIQATATAQPDLIYVSAVQWSHDGTKIAAVGTRLPSQQGYIRVLDVETGKVLYALDPNPGGYTSVAWSPDDRFIAMGSYDSSVWVVDLAAEKVVAGLFGHRATVTDVSWSPDGKKLVSSGNWDGLTILWDVTTYKKIREVEASGAFPEAVGYSPDGQRIAVSGEAGIRIYDVNDASQKPAHYFQFNVSGFAWSHDGSRIALGTWSFPSIVNPNQQVYAKMYIIDSQTGETLNDWATEDEGITGVVWSPDDKWIAAESIDGIIEVWDAQTGKTLTTYGANVNRDIQYAKHISFNLSGNLIAYGYVIPANAPPNYNFTENSPLYQAVQMGENGIRIFVPLPSLERLKGIMRDCGLEPSINNQGTTLETINELGRIRNQIMDMKSGQISPTCKTDLLAITEVVPTR